MKNEFYKMEYESWDEGTSGLPLDIQGAYLRICHQMYRVRGPMRSDPAIVGGLLCIHPNKARAMIKGLVKAGKLTLTEDGRHLINMKVEQVLLEREVMSTQKAHAGHTGGTRRAHNLKKGPENKDRRQASASSTSSLL